MIGAIDTDALLELVWVAPLAVLTVTVAWGLVIRGTALALEARRNGRSGAAALHALVALAGGALFTAARHLRAAGHDLEGLTFGASRASRPRARAHTATRSATTVAVRPF